MSFLHFAAKAIGAFVGPAGELLDVEVMPDAPDEKTGCWYFGFDGDSTGDYLADAFHGPDGEAVVAQRSKTVRLVLDELAQLIRSEIRDEGGVIFAEGDNLLFKGPFRPSLIADLQRRYHDQTGLTSSIGYGRSLRETSIAMRLAKSRAGDSCVGVTIALNPNEQPNKRMEPTRH